MNLPVRGVLLASLFTALTIGTLKLPTVQSLIQTVTHPTQTTPAPAPQPTSPSGITKPTKTILLPIAVPRGRIIWNLQTLALDGVDQNANIATPLKEAISFVGKYSKFNVSYAMNASNLAHTYTKYDCQEGKQTCVAVFAKDINQAVIYQLPVADSYGIFWKAYGQPPLQAGSTWGVANGILKGGIKRPYFSIPTDVWWYNNQPFEGFQSRAAQIITHELVNTINAKLEVAPYNCTSLTGTPGDPASKYESDRLKKLTKNCYAKYLIVNPSAATSTSPQ